MINLDNLAFSLKSIFLCLCATFWILSLDQSSSSWTFSSKTNLPLDLPLIFQLLLFFIFIILICLFFNMLGHSLYVSLGPHIFKLLIYSFLTSVYITHIVYIQSLITPIAEVSLGLLQQVLTHIDLFHYLFHFDFILLIYFGTLSVRIH